MSENKNKNDESQSQSSNVPQPNQAVEIDTQSLIDKANDAAERLEKANIEQEKLLKRAENILVEERLSGKTTAGNQEKEKTPDEIAKENAKKLLAGTGYEDKLFN
jgi:hypothetical protein